LPSALVRRVDLLVDLAVGVLASWTLVYHVCLVAGLDVIWALVLEALALAGWAALALFARREPDDQDASVASEGARPVRAPRSGVETRLLVGTALASVGAAVTMATYVVWPVVVSLWLLAGLGAATLAWSRPVGGVDEHSGRRRGDRSEGAWAALVWGVALAALSLFTLRSNPDDLFYVNLSQWVVDQGTFAVRDTIFSDQAFPMTNFPPMASYDALVGTLARQLGVDAASVAYLVVPPVATFLAVLALWRLLRAWGVRPVWLALSLALTFLLFDAVPGYAAPGDLFLTRMWQGKVILLCVMVPVLLVYALRYVQRPTRGRAGWLLAGGVAAVGLSTTAMFLVPLLALAGAAPLLRTRRWAALGGFAAMAAYPVAAGAVTVATGGRSADDFESRKLYRFEPSWFGHEIFSDGVLALVGVSGVLLATLLIPHRAARLTSALLVVATGITFVPGVTHLAYDLVGLGPTLWRVSWVCSVGASVGVLGAALATRPPARLVRVLAPLAMVLALVLGGQPIWSSGAGVDLVNPPHWQRPAPTVVVAEEVTAALEPGDVVLAAPYLGITVAVMTTRVKTVAPRRYYMDPLRAIPEFHYAERDILMDFVDPPPEGRPDPDAVERALDIVDVTMVCLPSSERIRLGFLSGLGFTPALATRGWVCVRR
jgi:hypothetical protein